MTTAPYEKELIFLKGFAKGHGYWNTLKAIHAATTLHEGQTRRTGEPYISHPTRVASSLVSLGIHNDGLLSEAFLHDVLEDCPVDWVDLVHKHHMDASIISDLELLSKNGKTTDKYYQDLRNGERFEPIFVKLSDRCHNLSTMVGAFSLEKMKAYVVETETYVLPLCKAAIQRFPEYSDALYTMKYHMESILFAVKGFVQLLESQSNKQEVFSS
ncbi:HD domain-containing protein [Cytobacillus sp. FJAT-54145]|uniref:HD domain-containing protein n=1 Tax=Cytobacillus spartinae TaxID=3299023 RepID=A0ABW6KE26_9BACI